MSDPVSPAPGSRWQSRRTGRVVVVLGPAPAYYGRERPAVRVHDPEKGRKSTVRVSAFGGSGEYQEVRT